MSEQERNPGEGGMGRRIAAVLIPMLVIGSSVTGFLDAGLLGALGGTVVGLVAGSLASWALGAVCSVFRPASRESGGAVLHALGFGWRLTACVVQLAIVALLAYECFWLTNMASLLCSHDTGALITQATSRGDRRTFLRETLRERRWQFRLFGSQPVRWLLTPRAVELNETTGDLIDLLNGKNVPPKQPQRLRDRILGELLTMGMQSDGWFATRLTNPLLNDIGAGLCKATEEEANHCVREMSLQRPRESLFGRSEENKTAAAR